MRSDLDLSYCKNISDKGLKHLINMRSGLHLSHCEITDNGLEYL